IPRSGNNLFDAITIDGKNVAQNARLLCTLEDRSAFETNRTLRYQRFVSDVNKITVEQSGPVRAVVKIEGIHKAEEGDRKWLPFIVRLYFHADHEPIRLVHTIIFDGDDQKDFISDLGLVFSVPMREQVHNRHVRFSGQDGGLW